MKDLKLDIKVFVANQLVGKRLHFKCDCLVPLDFEGVVVGHHIENGEIIFEVQRTTPLGTSIVNIGINHPNMTVEVVTYGPIG